MRKSSYDYIIVGHGLAGSVLSTMLIDNGFKVLVIDKFFANSSSQVAAGIVNPITGRRVVKSWMADELIPFASNYYRKSEKDLNAIFFYSKDVLEVIHNVKDLNEWTIRTEEPGMLKYISADAPEKLYKGIISDFKKLIRITSSGWMNIPLFIELNRKNLEHSNSYIDEEVDIASMKIFSDEIIYGKYSCSKIIFCEGYGALNNPFWKHIPFVPAKGEILTIKCKSLPEDFILMSGIFLIPLGDSKFRVGATYEWNFKDEFPTENGKEKLNRSLSELLKIPFEIIEHTAGIRPTIKDRRPVIGQHKEFKNVFIFNGLGTKGVLLAPYFADHFVNVLGGKGKMMEEVDVKRFES